MSKEVEKKYRVESFDTMLRKVNELGAKPTIDIHSTHYYARLDSDDTIKMIDYPDKVEIHEVSTRNGLHSIDKIIGLDSVAAGYEWFKQRGYHTLEVVKMHDREFSYLDGGFALYAVDGVVNSVILGYEEARIPAMEEVFELTLAEEILVPYNKYLAKLGKLRLINI